MKDKKIDFHADMEKEDSDFFDKLKTDHALGSNRELMKFLRLLLEGKIDMFQASKLEELDQRTSKGEPTTESENAYKQYVIDNGQPLVTEAQAKQIAALKEKVRIKSEAEEKHQEDIRETERIETEELAKRKNLRGQNYQKSSVNYDTSQGCPPEF